jgi:hypothetical protein
MDITDDDLAAACLGMRGAFNRVLDHEFPIYLARTGDDATLDGFDQHVRGVLKDFIARIVREVMAEPMTEAEAEDDEEPARFVSEDELRRRLGL